MDKLLDFCSAILLLTGGLLVFIAWIIFWVMLIIEIIDNFKEANTKAQEDDDVQG